MTQPFYPYAPPDPSDPFGLGPARRANPSDAASMVIGERRWGDSLIKSLDVPGSSTTELAIAQVQILSVKDVARVWALRLSCTWQNFASNFLIAPADDGVAAFTVTSGVGSGMVPHTYLMPLLAVQGFAELFIPALPAQAIQVQVSLAFTPANNAARTEEFQFAASVAPYTRLRNDE